MFRNGREGRKEGVRRKLTLFVQPPELLMENPNQLEPILFGVDRIDVTWDQDSQMVLPFVNKIND